MKHIAKLKDNGKIYTMLLILKSTLTIIFLRKQKTEGRKGSFRESFAAFFNFKTYSNNDG